MRILDRYICREVFSHSLLGLAIFTFVLFVPQLVRLMELAVRHAADAPSVAMLFLCTLPGVLTFTLPMAVLVGVLIGLGRMSADSEVIALHALGIGQRRILLPVGAMAIVATLLTGITTLWLGPAALAKFRSIEQRLRASQASFEVQPRVFDERFPKLVLYVQDVDATSTHWRGIFLAESSEDGTRLTLAEEAIVLADRAQGKLQVFLRNGSSHEYDRDAKGRYSVSTFGESDIAVTVTDPNAVRQRRLAPQEYTLGALWRASRKPAGSTAVAEITPLDARAEMHRRFAFPFACIAFALLGVPLGARPRRGGRAGAFLLTLLLICGYYLLFVLGSGLARQGATPAWLGLWSANLVAALAGIALLPRMEEPGEGVIARWADWLAEVRHGRPLRSGPPARSARRAERAATEAETNVSQPKPAARTSSNRFLFWRERGERGASLILDIYVIKYYFKFLVLLLIIFLLLFHAFTFFELLNDIAKHNIPFFTVFSYFAYLTPFLAFQLLPLAALVAGIVTFTVLAKNNEITAFKAGGISMYRLCAPLLLAGLVLSGAMLVVDDAILPGSNQRQDALRNQIKGRPAKTFFQPRRQWIFGQQGRLYNYEFFDPDTGVFAGLNVYELNPDTFQMRRRIFAQRATWDPAARVWDLQRGWVRDFEGSRVTRYEEFSGATPPELTEPPAYFHREVRQSYQMDWQELRRYIRDLEQAGFDVARLRVQWHRKFAYPFMVPVIVLLGIPLAVRFGARGAVVGVALALGLGIGYWAVAALFEALGAVGQLPPLLGAWSPNVIFGLLGMYFFFEMPT